MYRNNKKGISPLIATVIIIGFTIVLAALVIQFGTGFLKRTTEGAEQSSQRSQLCSIGIAGLEVSAMKDAVTGDIKVRLDNKNDVKLFGAQIRVYGDNNVASIDKADIETAATPETDIVTPFGLKTLTVTAADYGEGLAGETPKKVGVLVHVRRDAEDLSEIPFTCDNEFKVGVKA